MRLNVSKLKCQICRDKISRVMLTDFCLVKSSCIVRTILSTLTEILDPLRTNYFLQYIIFINSLQYFTNVL